MIKEIYDLSEGTKLREEEAEPVCGEHFCDECGDCLSCYGAEEYCREAGQSHTWIEYTTRPSDSIKQ